MKPIRISVHMGITSAFMLLIILTSLGLCTFLFIRLQANFREELRKQMQSTVAEGVLGLDAAAHEKLRSIEDEKLPLYRAYKTKLQQIKAAGVDIYFVYTMRMGGSGLPEFVVDAEEDPEQMSHIGDVYDKPTPSLLKAFAPGAGVQVEEDFAADEWGTWLSGFAPLKDDSGKVVAILGIDMSAKRILENEAAIYWALISITLGVSLVILILAYFVSRRITRTLGLIEKDMVKIQKFDIDDELVLKSFFREIQNINNVVGDVKQSLRSFKKYVPADLVAQLIADHQQASLGGEKKDITVFFSDIENFTTWSEVLSPEELIQIMARYFAGMTQIIMDHQGTVDKYIGDAIMAFWGAPKQLENHAELAARAALKCMEFQKDFNLELARQGMVQINTRIGLNSGEALVGNVGYEQRLNYTALGDHVNLASRLESLNKFYGTNIIMSHYTYDRICEKFLARKIDCVVVKGRRRYIYVYELLADGEADELMTKIARATDSACSMYFQRQWKEAAVVYDKLLAANPHDRPAQIMAERCRQYIANDPGPDWEGVLVLREK